jgi:diguanylate cyclase (GGDEF)-like protein
MKYHNKLFLFNTKLVKYLCLFYFFCLNHITFAEKYSPDPIEPIISYQVANKFINGIRNNKLDYLKNAKQLEKIFEISKSENWHSLELEMAALYSELLFRQEKYEALNTHINNYINNQTLVKQWDLYLLLLKSKLKYLSQEEDQIQARALVKNLIAWLPERSLKENIIIYRALSHYYTAVDAIKKSLSVSLQGLELSVIDNDFSSQGFFLRKISDAYNLSNEKEKALDYAQRSVAAFEKDQDEYFTSKAYWSLGNILLDIRGEEEALVYLKKALLYFKSVNVNKGIIYTQYLIASTQYKQGNIEGALITLEENILLASSTNVFDMQLASMILLSEIFLEQGNLQKANELNDKVFMLLNKFSRGIFKSNFLSKRYKLKRQLGLNEEAFEAIEQELIFTKRHLEATSKNNIRMLQVKFEVKEKEAEIFRLAQVNAMTEFKAKEEYQQKIIWRLSTIIAVILILVSLLLINRQVNQRKKYHAIANTDHLTNSQNRRGIMLMAEQSLRDNELTIAIVDLDYFKKINDTLGHDIGDIVLIAFANAARKTLRENDKFGRYGGEEWLFILHTTNKSVVDNIFKRLNENFANYCIDIKSGHPALDWDITFSVGASITSKANNNLDFHIKKADELLYQAKADGRNKVVIG